MVALAIIFYCDLWLGIGVPETMNDGLIQGIAGLGVGGGIVVFSRWGAKVWKPVRDLEDGFRDLIGPLTVGDVFLAALASSVGEELFFRAAIQPLVGLWIASIIFAVLHWGPSRQFSAWPILALGAGLILGGLFEYFQMVWASIIAHFTVNFVNLRYLSQPKPDSFS